MRMVTIKEGDVSREVPATFQVKSGRNFVTVNGVMLGKHFDAFKSACKASGAQFFAGDKSWGWDRKAVADAPERLTKLVDALMVDGFTNQD